MKSHNDFVEKRDKAFDEFKRNHGFDWLTYFELVSYCSKLLSITFEVQDATERSNSLQKSWNPSIHKKDS